MLPVLRRAGLPSARETWGNKGRIILSWNKTGWSIFPTSSSWESWDCSTWRREGSGGSYQIGKSGKVRAKLFFLVSTDRIINRHKLKHGTFYLDTKKNNKTFLQVWSFPGTGCPERWSLHPQRCLKPELTALSNLPSLTWLWAGNLD